VTAREIKSTIAIDICCTGESNGCNRQKPMSMASYLYTPFYLVSLLSQMSEKVMEI
jgi:hypothetical protein